MATDNQWTWWQNALDGKVAPIHDGDPQSGYYRSKKKGAGDVLVPVAYWKDSRTGQQRCHVDGADADPQRALEMWPYVSKRPVTYNAYKERLTSGRWHDESAAVIGDNQAPPDDNTDTIAQRIDDLTREAERLIEAGAATADDVANQASDLAQTLGEIEAKITALHKVEKEPHFAAGRAIDLKWFSLRDTAAAFKARLKAVVVTPFLVARDKAAKAAAAKAIAAGTAPADLPTQRTTAGTTKRATALRTQTLAEVVDWDVLLSALHEHSEIMALAQSIANASAKVGVALPGTRIVKTQAAA